MRVRTMLARRLLSDPDAAISLMEAVLAGHANGRLPPPPVNRITLIEGLMKRAGDGDLQRAHQLLEENESALRAYPAAYSMSFFNRYLLAYVTHQEGHSVQADTALAELEGPLRQHLTTTNNRLMLREVLLLRAMIALRRGDTPGARALLVRAIDHVERAFGPDHQAVRRTRAELEALDRTGTFQLLR